MTRRHVRLIVFSPCAFLESDEADHLRVKLVAERPASCPDVFVDHPVLVGRGTVAIAMPAGTWAWDFGLIDRARDRDGLADIVEAVKRTTGRRRFRHRDVVDHEGQLYLHRPVLLALASCRDVRATMARAALGLMDGLLAQGGRGRQRPYRPLHDRKVMHGRRARGLGWAPSEDAELQRAFGFGEPGRRLRLQEWEVLLGVRLEGRRTRGSVLARVTRLRREARGVRGNDEQYDPNNQLP